MKKALVFKKGNRFIFGAPEFFNMYVFFSVLLFVMNNFWFKYKYHNWLTGKLSDFMFCFFFPLYISAFISLFLTLGKTKRAFCGVLITGFSFFLVKISLYFSELLNYLLSPISFLVFGRASINLVDHSDLIALFFLIPAVLIVQLKGRGN